MSAFKLSATAQAFHDSRAWVKIIMGPVGGGKSTAALFELLRRAAEQVPYKGVRRSKFIILRNTMQQLKSTVKPLIDQWFITLPDQPMGEWRLTENTFEIRKKMGHDGTILHTEFVLMAADTPDDVRRLLSVECSAAWVEEAREVDPEVFSGLQGRTNRFPNRAAGGVTYPGVICSTNPPPMGGFWHDAISNPPDKWEVFIQPAALLDDGSLNPEADNLANLAPAYYENLVAGKSSEWIDVYLKNKFGAGDYGQPVYKSTFKKSFHVAKEPLRPIMQSLNPLVVGCDNGLTAAATIGQQDARGRVNILAECFVPDGETMGFETFLDKHLVPLLRNKFPAFRPENIVFSMDPACWARSSLNERTLAQAAHARGFKVVKASTNDPDRRIGAVENLLARQIDGGPGFLIDPSCTHLIGTFEWSYRFKKSNSGQSTTRPDKNHAANQADSCQYLALAFDAGLSHETIQQRKALAIKKAQYVYV